MLARTSVNARTSSSTGDTPSGSTVSTAVPDSRYAGVRVRGEVGPSHTSWSEPALQPYGSQLELSAMICQSPSSNCTSRRMLAGTWIERRGALAEVTEITRRIGRRGQGCAGRSHRSLSACAGLATVVFVVAGDGPHDRLGWLEDWSKEEANSLAFPQGYCKSPRAKTAVGSDRDELGDGSLLAG